MQSYNNNNNSKRHYQSNNQNRNPNQGGGYNQQNNNNNKRPYYNRQYDDEYDQEEVKFGPTKNQYGSRPQTATNYNHNNNSQQQKPRYNNYQGAGNNNGYGGHNQGRYQNNQADRRQQQQFAPQHQPQFDNDVEMDEGWGLQPGGQQRGGGQQNNRQPMKQRPQTAAQNNFGQKPQASQQAQGRYGPGQMMKRNPESNSQTQLQRFDKDDDCQMQDSGWDNAFSGNQKNQGKTQITPSKKSVAGHQAQHSSALVPVNKACRQVNVVSNQYRLSLGDQITVHQYRLDVLGLKMYDAALIQRILRSKRKAMEQALGTNVCSGESIYLLSELEEDAKFSTQVAGQPYDIVIRVETHSIVNLKDQFDNEKNSTTQQLINVIIKTAFKDTKMKQIGRAPRFFDVEQPIQCAANIMIWQGFKASAFQSQMGCTLVMDSIFKFMSTKTCLDRIVEIKNTCRDKSQFKTLVEMEFSRNSVIANWGNKRTYYVDEVVWDNTPASQTFDFKGDQITMIEYFKSNYNMQITQPNQPLFAVKNAGTVLFLPPEFCLTDGVPAAMRSSFEMREALKTTRVDPVQKMNKIKQMVSELFRQKAIQDWGLRIESAPIEMSTSVLQAPQLIKGNQVVVCNENELRRLPIQNAVDLENEEWIFIYDQTMFELANKIVESFYQSAKQLNIRVAQPYWIETQNEKDFKGVEAELMHYMTENNRFKHPQMVVILLRYENNYPAYKEIMQKFRMPSQVITRQNANKFNLSKASNILRQVNSKMGGDLYNMKFPAKLDSMRTMLVGIDVCHAAAKSVVGFSASINKEMSQYYSDYIVQKKGHEVVKDQLYDRLDKALKVFADNHKGQFPSNLIIYRDGVGDAQRDQVIDFELKQFQETIEALVTNKATVKPQMTVVFVNKRINQRFFMLDDRNKPVNPPSGCIIDRGLSQTSTQTSENEAPSDKNFDFFMTPASANQGCVLPTHFYVSRNDSPLNRLELEQLTYALCHFYFNWAGPIKVPAPCQYAHKIADFFTTIGVAKKKLNLSCGEQHQQLEQAIKQKVKPLNEKLHFL